jgi:DNA-binding transcriptional regulator/RsmH inhibitor MraZ
MATPTAIQNALDPNHDGVRLFASLHPFGCIALMPPEAFQRLLDPYRHHREFSLTVQRHQAVLLANTENVLCNKYGRIRISPELLRKAGIETPTDTSAEIIFVGQDDAFHVWNPERYLRFEEETLRHHERALDELREKTEEQLFRRKDDSD